MGAFFIYSIKVALCMVVFYLLYKLAMSRDTYHRFNRITLLSLMVMSLLLPLVQLRLSDSHAGITELGNMVTSDAVDYLVATDAPAIDVPVVVILFVVYVAGVLFFLVREICLYSALVREMHRGRDMGRQDGMRIIVVDEAVSPFSWFDNIVISRKDYEENPREILTHEKAHARRYHSVDVLFCDFVLIFQWFNPAAWLMKAELKNVHEYEADEAVINQGVNASDYQLLLIRKAVGDRFYSMANNLNHSLLKKRIAMMLTKKSNPWSRAKVLIAAPLAAIAIVAFASPEVKALSDEVHDGIDVVGYAGNASEALNIADVMPRFPGGEQKMMEYISKQIRYPKEARDKKIEGRVVVGFVVKKDGSITDVAIRKGVSPELNDEAVRVVAGMPKWTPGMENGEAVDVKYVLPVTFRLTGHKAASGAKAASVVDDNLYIVIDGKHVTPEELNALAPTNIESMQVIKEKTALEKLGRDAAKAQGAIVIKTKK